MKKAILILKKESFIFLQNYFPGGKKPHKISQSTHKNKGHSPLLHTSLNKSGSICPKSSENSYILPNAIDIDFKSHIDIAFL